ncbi:MAG: hypothetical protein LBJ12_06485 [Oscillospiraceae bacterium]|nr:hypothetical protein [Oscillospiraceae bacterium]
MIYNEMIQPETGVSPYQFYIDAIDLKAYSASDFRKYPSETGFERVEMITKEKIGICVIVKTEKEK